MNRGTADRGTCARCHRDDLRFERILPDGRICSTCWSRATRTAGTCTTCRQQRLLPARGTDGAVLCSDCGHLDTDFHCSRCDREWRLRRGLCEWCYLDDRLDAFLGGGTVDLTGLHRSLLAVDRPDSIIIWLYNHDVQNILTGLARGTIELSRDAIDRQTPRQTTDHIAALLVQAGLLPRRDPYLTRFDRWVNERLPKTADPSGQLLLQQFARWQLRPGLADAARTNTARNSQVVSRTQQLTVAGQFLDQLTTDGLTPATATQHTLDAWLAAPPTTRWKVRGFINFLTARGITRNLAMPPAPTGRGRRLDQRQRLDHLRAVLDPATGPIDCRAAAMLLLLYAQPFPILTNLTLDDIRTTTTSTLTIRFAGDHVDVPAPFDRLLLDQIANRSNTNTASNNSSGWLFPGRRPGLPLVEQTLQDKVRRLGINLRHAKAAALADLVTACPPPVVARTLGYTDTTTNRHAARAGTTWHRYAANRRQP